MSRIRIALVLAALLACSPAAQSSPPPDPPRRPTVAATAGDTSEVALRDPREAILTATVLELLDKEHVRKRAVDDELSREAFKTYLERLDSTKMFLLADQAVALERHVTRIDDELRAGKLDLAHEGAQLFVERVGVIDKLIADLLSKPMDLNDDESIELDPKKVKFAATEQELRERWRKRLELEVIERVASMESRLKADKEKDKDKPGTGKP